jgi:hypothetical protein
MLAGPLLGLAWGTSTKTQWHANLHEDPSGDPPAASVAPLPYTLSSSLSHRLACRLAAVSSGWQQVKPQLAKPLLQLTVSSVLALGVAAQLGRQCVAFATVGLAIALVSGLGRSRWVSSLGISIWTPLFLTWMLGNASFGELRLPSVVVAAAIGLALCGSTVVAQGSRSLVWQVAPQAVLAATLMAVKQPVAAALAMLLATPQVLLVPLLSEPVDHERYFRSIQWGLLASMFVAALAVGYGH